MTILHDDSLQNIESARYLVSSTASDARSLEAIPERALLIHGVGTSLYPRARYPRQPLHWRSAENAMERDVVGVRRSQRKAH